MGDVCTFFFVRSLEQGSASSGPATESGWVCSVELYWRGAKPAAHCLCAAVFLPPWRSPAVVTGQLTRRTEDRVFTEKPCRPCPRGTQPRPRVPTLPSWAPV